MLIRILAMGFAAAERLRDLCPARRGSVAADTVPPVGQSADFRPAARLRSGHQHRRDWRSDRCGNLARGRNFIDSTDHGRQLQSASNFDAGSPMIPETFNPTEAGSVFDGAGPTSSSRLLHALATGNRLQTTTQMAFWLRPDGNSLGHPAKNKTVLSNHLLTKWVTIGYRNLPQVIEYNVTFGLPVDEQHTYAQFELITGYMPAEFNQFLIYLPDEDEFRPISVGPGEQAYPVVLATQDSAGPWAVIRPNAWGQTGGVRPMAASNSSPNASTSGTAWPPSQVHWVMGPSWSWGIWPWYSRVSAR
ncbi:MAG: hypothetical protein R3C12_11080 [Planctomycetaceae bacterium]